jgi:hypothetical protein
MLVLDVDVINSWRLRATLPWREKPNFCVSERRDKCKGPAGKMMLTGESQIISFRSTIARPETP